MLAVHLTRVLAALAVEDRANRAVDTADGLVCNVVYTVDCCLGCVTNCVLCTTDTSGGYVVGTVEAGGENIAGCAEETADWTVDGREDTCTILTCHVAARVAASTLAVHLTGVLAIHLARVLAIYLARVLAGVLAIHLAGVLTAHHVHFTVRHLFLRNTAIFFYAHWKKPGIYEKLVYLNGDV